MADAKIEFKVGSIDFLCEGEKEWVAQQFTDFIKHIPTIAKTSPTKQITEEDTQEPNQTGAGKGKTLASFLKEKGATSNQVKKFLATAIWLHGKGEKKLTTTKVSKALSDNQQGRLSNPAQCLNNNVEKGFCEKEGNEFYVTPEGHQDL